METEARADLTLRDYLAPVIQRWWLVLGLTVAATLGVFLYYASQDEIYRSFTKVYTAQEGNSLLGIGTEFSDERTVQNQVTLLKSNDVAASVAKKISFKGSPGELAARVTATPASGTDFIDILGEGRTAQEAADITNGFARAFIDARSAARREQAEKALTALREQLREIPATGPRAPERAPVEGQIRQLEIAISTNTGGARQVDPAVAPAKASYPRPTKKALVAFPLALLGSILLAYVLHRLDPRLKRVEEAAELYQRPVLASIHHDDEILCFDNGRPSLSSDSREAFRALRVNVDLLALDKPLRKLLVTSASAGEGKSTVVRNIGLAAREAGRDVVLVDADLRKASLTPSLGVDPKRPGLVDVLAGTVTGDAALVPIATPTAGPGVNGNENGSAASRGLQLLPAGTQPPDPSALLGAQRTWALLDELAEMFEIVLVDTPPVLAVSDAIPLLAWADAVIVVARTGVTDRRSARRAAEVIGRVPDANLIGVVVNDVSQPEATGYGGYYGGYYGKYGKRGRTPVETSA